MVSGARGLMDTPCKTSYVMKHVAGGANVRDAITLLLTLFQSEIYTEPKAGR